MPGPVVERGDRVSFRVAEREDTAFLQRSSTDPRIRFPLGSSRHRNHEQERETFENRVENDGEAAFVVCLDGDDDPTRIGFVAVHNVDGDRAWLTYWLLPEYHGEGYGRETAEFAVDHTFEHYDVHGISAGAYDFNDASRGLLESVGFSADVRSVESDYLDGEYRDSFTYGLLRREWERDR